MTGQPLVGVVMGSDSDWPVMRAAADALDEFGVAYEADVVSAHRMPREMVEYGSTAAGRGLRVIVAGAGGAAHLPGMLASVTPLPVIGVPVPLANLSGLDSLLSIVQMPAGIPVATVAVGGARNAGLLAVELFDTPRGLLVNELAMRAHNCGHWTIEGATTSQFEQPLRAVLDLPLGAPSMLAPHAVMANVLGGTDPDVYDRYIHVMAADPGVKVHLYGKAVRPGRKIGHVTVLGDDVAGLRDRARRAASFLRWGTEDGE